MSISEQILEYLRNSQETVYVIAKESKLGRGNLSRALRGERKLGRTEIDALAEYFGCRLTKPRRNA